MRANYPEIIQRQRIFFSSAASHRRYQRNAFPIPTTECTSTPVLPRCSPGLSLHPPRLSERLSTTALLSYHPGEKNSFRRRACRRLPKNTAGPLALRRLKLSGWGVRKTRVLRAGDIQVPSTKSRKQTPSSAHVHHLSSSHPSSKAMHTRKHYAGRDL